MKFLCIYSGGTESVKTGEVYDGLFSNKNYETGTTSYQLFDKYENPVAVIRNGFEDGFYHRYAFPTAIFSEMVEG